MEREIMRGDITYLSELTLDIFDVKGLIRRRTPSYSLRRSYELRKLSAH